MDPAIVSASAAVFGSMVGGMASIATAFFTQKSQSRRERASGEVRKRELVYSEFIAECSKLAIDALAGSLESAAALVQVYALQNRIRLTASDHVVAAAEATVAGIIDQYFKPKVSMQDLYGSFSQRHEDPLRAFSVACRTELRQLQAEF